MCLGVPGQVQEVEDGPLRLGRIRFGGIVKEASLAFVPEAQVGDYVLVHAGMALEVIDEEAARNVFEALRQLGEAEAAGLGPDDLPAEGGL
jgi:hydrogenase expression/formation protein HypC